MLEIRAVALLEGRCVRVTLSDGSIVERDLSELPDGVGVFERISVDDDAFRGVYVDLRHAGLARGRRYRAGDGDLGRADAS